MHTNMYGYPACKQVCRVPPGGCGLRIADCGGIRICGLRIADCGGMWICGLRIAAEFGLRLVDCGWR
eukprot:13183892-Alexandrium_andersonii.AAC.1